MSNLLTAMIHVLFSSVWQECLKVNILVNAVGQRKNFSALSEGSMAVFIPEEHLMHVKRFLVIARQHLEIL
ncbi:hypothetical protein AML36_23140 [Escherichia coli]|nr:hypothetical protein AML36_23140 [Escherichia coli]